MVLLALWPRVGLPRGLAFFPLFFIAGLSFLCAMFYSAVYFLRFFGFFLLREALLKAMAIA